MYIEKRWLVPGILTLLLFGALFAIALVLMGERIPAASGSPSSPATTTADHRPVHLTAERVDPDPAATPELSAVLPTPPPAPETHTSTTTAAAPQRQQPEEVVDIDTEK